MKPIRSLLLALILLLLAAALGETASHLYDDAETCTLPDGGEYSLTTANRAEVTTEALNDWFYNYLQPGGFAYGIILFSDGENGEGVYASAALVEVGARLAQVDGVWTLRRHARSQRYIAREDGLQCPVAASGRCPCE